MLFISIQDFNQHDFFNVDLEFLKLKIELTNENRRIVKDIEQGELIDSFKFIDRFGYVLRLEDLSTGCKAILCMANSEKFVSFIECGDNVVNYVVNNFNHGKIVLFDENIQFETQNTVIDVFLNGYCFKTIKRLNYYLSDEFPFEPNLNIEGVESCDI